MGRTKSNPASVVIIFITFVADDVGITIAFVDVGITIAFVDVGITIPCVDVGITIPCVDVGITIIACVDVGYHHRLCWLIFTLCDMID